MHGLFCLSSIWSNKFLYLNRMHLSISSNLPLQTLHQPTYLFSTISSTVSLPSTSHRKPCVICPGLQNVIITASIQKVCRREKWFFQGVLSMWRANVKSLGPQTALKIHSGGFWVFSFFSWTTIIKIIAFTFYFALSWRPRQDEMILQRIAGNSVFLLYSINVVIDFILMHNPRSDTVKHIKKSIQSQAR